MGDAANPELMWEGKGEGKLLRAGNYTPSSRTSGRHPDEGSGEGAEERLRLEPGTMSEGVTGA